MGIDIDYEALQNFNLVQSDEEEYNVEVLMANPDLLDLDLGHIDSLSNSPGMSRMKVNLTLLNEQFHEMCPELNESQQHLFHFKMQYALHCK